MISDAEEEDATRDAIMIAAVQETEHYQIASYVTRRTWAGVLGVEEESASRSQRSAPHSSKRQIAAHP